MLSWLNCTNPLHHGRGMRHGNNMRSTLQTHSETMNRGPSGDHQWRVGSVHPTSEGLITYESCPCGTYRVRRSGILLAQTSGRNGRYAR